MAKKVDSDSLQQQMARLRSEITLQMNMTLEDEKNKTMAFDKDI